MTIFSKNLGGWPWPHPGYANAIGQLTKVRTQCRL